MRLINIYINCVVLHKGGVGQELWLARERHGDRSVRVTLRFEFKRIEHLYKQMNVAAFIYFYHGFEVYENVDAVIAFGEIQSSKHNFLSFKRSAKPLLS